MSVTPPSSWPWVDHPVSGLRHVTKSPCSDSLSLRLPYSVKLATQRKSLTHYTKGTPSPQLDWPSESCASGSRRPGQSSWGDGYARSRSRTPFQRLTCRIHFNLDGLLPRSLSFARQRTPVDDLLHLGVFCRAHYRSRVKEPRRPIKLGLRLFVCMRFQDLFHSPPGVLFAFPSRYWFTIGRLRVFSLGGWSPHLQTGFHVSRPTCLAPGSTFVSSVTGLSPTTAALSRAFSWDKC